MLSSDELMDQLSRLSAVLIEGRHWGLTDWADMQSCCASASQSPYLECLPLPPKLRLCLKCFSLFFIWTNCLVKRTRLFITHFRSDTICTVSSAHLKRLWASQESSAEPNSDFIPFVKSCLNLESKTIMSDNECQCECAQQRSEDRHSRLGLHRTDGTEWRTHWTTFEEVLLICHKR